MRPPEQLGWVSLAFVSQDVGGDHEFWIDLEEDVPISGTEVQDRVANNELRAIDPPRRIRPGQTLWQSPLGDVWLASEKDPIGDNEKVLLETLPVESSASVSTKELVARNLDPELRIPRLLVLDNGYVKGAAYRTLTQTMVSILDEMNGSKAQMLQPGSVPWDYIPVGMDTGLLHFCCDPYAANRNRKHVVDVVQIGSLKSYSAFVDSASPVYSELLMSSGRGLSVQQRLRKLFESIGDFEIGLYQETVATLEVLEVVRNLPGLTHRLHFGDDEARLRQWIGEAPERRVIICDWGIARDLHQITKADVVSKAGMMPSQGFDRTYLSGCSSGRSGLVFGYRVPQPMGFVHLRGDERWRSDLREALRRSLSSVASDGSGSRIWGSWHGSGGEGSVEAELRAVGIEILPLDGVRVELALEDVA